MRITFATGAKPAPPGFFHRKGVMPWPNPDFETTIKGAQFSMKNPAHF
jgi:hypothetical protein